jgi:hypothetical protein
VSNNNCSAFHNIRNQVNSCIWGSECVHTIKQCDIDSFPAANVSRITAENIKEGAQIGTVTGTMPETKQCRNAAYLASYDATGPSNLPLSNRAAGISTGTSRFFISTSVLCVR